MAQNSSQDLETLDSNRVSQNTQEIVKNNETQRPCDFGKLIKRTPFQKQVPIKPLMDKKHKVFHLLEKPEFKIQRSFSFEKLLVQNNRYG